MDFRQLYFVLLCINLSQHVVKSPKFELFKIAVTNTKQSVSFT